MHKALIIIKKTERGTRVRPRCAVCDNNNRYFLTRACRWFPSCVCVCVCVWRRERERERASLATFSREKQKSDQACRFLIRNARTENLDGLSSCFKPSVALFLDASKIVIKYQNFLALQRRVFSEKTKTFCCSITITIMGQDTHYFHYALSLYVCV